MDLVHKVVTISAFPLVSGGLHMRGLRRSGCEPLFLRTGTGRVGGSRVVLNSHIHLPRETEQAQLREELSLGRGEAETCHCFPAVKQLNNVVSGTVSKPGRELVTEHSWHSWRRPTKPSRNATDCEGPTYTASGCVQSSEFTTTAGARVTEKRTNHFAE